VKAVEREIDRIARRQGGHITRQQLLALGLGEDAIAYRVRIGRLIAVYQGVYAVGHLPTERVDLAKGALLACDPKAALCDVSAGYMWRIERAWSPQIHVITTIDRRPRGLKVHLSTSLLPRDIRIAQTVRVTSPALTLLHRAPDYDSKRLKRAIEDLRLARHLKVPQLEDVLTRFPRHPGTRPLTIAANLLTEEPTRSTWEDDWIPFAIHYKMPPHETNVHVHGHRTDVSFRKEGVIIELDGWETHQDRDAFEQDREIPAEILAATGIITVRITRRQFTADPTKQAARIHTILARQRVVRERAGGERHQANQRPTSQRHQA
jgi:hypothetical protein